MSQDIFRTTSKVLYHTTDLSIEWLATELTRFYEQKGYATEQSNSENIIQMQVRSGLLKLITDIIITLQQMEDGILVEIDLTRQANVPARLLRKRIVAEDAASIIDEIIRQRLPDVQTETLQG